MSSSALSMATTKLSVLSWERSFSIWSRILHHQQISLHCFRSRFSELTNIWGNPRNGTPLRHSIAGLINGSGAEGTHCVASSKRFSAIAISRLILCTTVGSWYRFSASLQLFTISEGASDLRSKLCRGLAILSATTLLT